MTNFGAGNFHLPEVAALITMQPSLLQRWLQFL
jgi:hypothetical protein